MCVQGEPLRCLPFRAWAPGHPKTGSSRKECVVLASNRYWETEDCSRRLPYICELVPDGPLSPVERYCAPINNISKNWQQLIICHVQHISVLPTRGFIVFNPSLSPWYLHIIILFNPSYWIIEDRCLCTTLQYFLKLLAYINCYI